MADEDTETQTAPAPALPAGMTADQVNQVIQQYGLMPQMPERDTTPVRRSITSLLGEALGGGVPTEAMTPQEREAAGNRALMNAGIGLMAASRYSPGQTIFSNLAQGLQGAQRSEIGSAAQAMNYLGAQQDWALKQQQAHLDALKTALPFLQLGYRQSLPSPFAGNAPGGGGAAPGGGGAPGGGSYLTGDKAKDLPLIAQHESGGDPTALNYVARADPSAYARGATASGKYQMVNSTWQEGAKLAGVDTSQYPTAMSAPEDVQDKVAGAVYDKYGTKPWDASTYKQQWVPTPTGQMILANAAPGARAGSPQQPAPYKVAGPAVAPPGGTTAPATGNLPVPPIPPTRTPPATPAPQQVTQADQPPTPPPVTTPPTQPPIDLKSAPDTTLSPEDYIRKHWTPLTPEEVAKYAPGPQGQLAVDRAAAVQQAQADAQAARNAYLQARQMGSPDQTKLFSAINEADSRVDAAEKAYNTAVQGLQTEGAKNLLAADDQQRQQLRADYKTIVADPRNAAALAKQQGDQAIALERAKGSTASEEKVMQGLDETFDSAKSAIDQINLTRTLSQASGDPTFVQQLQKTHPDLVRWIANLGGLDDDTVQRLGTAGAMDAAMNKLISMARTGSGFQRMTNLDVQILSSQAPGGTDPQAWREAKLAYLQTYLERQMQYVTAVHELRADGMPLQKARVQAQQQAGSVVPTVPSFTDQPGASASQQRAAWAQKNGVQPGTFVIAPNGQLTIAGGAQRPQQQQQPQAQPSLVPVR